MRIGLALDIHGSGSKKQLDFPHWKDILSQTLVAEEAGFDAIFLPDHLLYHNQNENIGAWESFSLAGALAASTSTIEIGHSMVNAPYRSPALIAKMAETLDEISNGRYILGLGAGNTPKKDYLAFGFPSDKRYSRFEEAIQIIHPMLKSGSANFKGKYWSANEADLVLRGPRPQGPPIVIAAWGPKMLRLAAKFADSWNGWRPIQIGPSVETFKAMIEQLEIACREVERDPHTLGRTLDIQIDPLGIHNADQNPLRGSFTEIAEGILEFVQLEIDEVRCYPLWPDGLPIDERLDLIEKLNETVKVVHSE